MLTEWQYSLYKHTRENSTIMLLQPSMKIKCDTKEDIFLSVIGQVNLVPFTRLPF